LRDTLELMSVAAIVLAAGASRRLGQPKQLLMLGGETLLGRALRLATEAGAAPVFSVLGANHEVILSTIQSENTIVVVNRNWVLGLATSIQAGLQAVESTTPNIAGVLVMTCDQPRLNADHLRLLIKAFEAKSAPTIVASSYDDARGTPAVFPRNSFPRLLALRGDRGARAVIARPPCPVISLSFMGGEIDIDLPTDLAQLE
jgi:molybdenum cofactor cytidylyltransferase